MKTVRQMSKISGVSVRTLHYYDKIGLLKPKEKTESGYRLYGEGEIKRLQTILLLKELDFPLKSIKTVIDNPDFDAVEVISEQIKLLEMKKEHIEGLIKLARKITEKGVNIMDFKAFDKSKIREYAKEAEQKYSKTAEYKEYNEKSKNRSEGENNLINSGLMKIFCEFGKIKDEPADGENAQNLVLKLKNYITENYYTCSDSVLSSLGQMYAEDERFKQNIDGMGGENTAEFVKKSIDAFVGK